MARKRILFGPLLDRRPSWERQATQFIASRGTRGRSSGRERPSSRRTPGPCASGSTLIYRRTKNRRAVQLLLGHSKLESTVRYLGIDVDDALETSEQTEIRSGGRLATLAQCGGGRPRTAAISSVGADSQFRTEAVLREQPLPGAMRSSMMGDHRRHTRSDVK